MGNKDEPDRIAFSRGSCTGSVVWLHDLRMARLGLGSCEDSGAGEEPLLWTRMATLVMVGPLQGSDAPRGADLSATKRLWCRRDPENSTRSRQR